MKLQEISPRATSHQINKVNEGRFGFRIDYSKLNLHKARGLSQALGENMNRLRRDFGAHNAEKNPKYMELLMVREGLNRWIEEHRQINESEIAKSGAILAAKDIVDSMQDMLEDISKMQNEELPALIDTIRDQIGQPQADQFKSTVSPIFQELYTSLQNARETADGAARALAGEQVAAPMDMGAGATPPAPGGEIPAPDMSSDLDTDGEEGADGFDATDAAAGGEAGLGREPR
jgi:hypothetical protein